MIKSKFIQIFYGLNPKEKVGFNKMVQSPFFNKQESVIRLMNYLYPLDLYKNRKMFDRTKMFKAVFEHQSYKLSKLRHVMSDLTQLLEEYLVINYRKTKKIDYYLDLSKALKLRNHDGLSQQTLKKVEKMQNDNPLRDIHYLKQNFCIEQTKYLQSLVKRSNDQYLQTLNDSFDNYCIAEKLKHSCRILSHQGMHLQNYDMGLLTKVIEYVNTHSKVLENPTILLYYYYYRAVTSSGDGTKYFKIFKEQLFLSQQHFEKKEMRDLYILATNYCIKGLNNDPKSFFLTEIYDLYKEALQIGALLENGMLSPFAYSNIVSVALNLDHKEWTWDFIHQYQNKLAVKNKKPYLDLNLSKWYFEEGNYEKAAELIESEPFEDLHLNLSAKMLLLKIYYYLDEFDLLDALFNRFQTYLSRQKTLSYHKDNYKNIIRFTRRLVAINPFSEKTKIKLREDILSAEILTERSWLLQELNKI